MGKIMLATASLVLVAAVILALPHSAKTEEAGVDKMLAHDVFFKLKDSSEASKQKLVEACKKHLTKHPGTVFFAAGTLAADFNREVNDRDYDVALHIYFQDKAAHDRYQDSPRHVQFVNENKDSWSKVRVFDSYVEN